MISRPSREPLELDGCFRFARICDPNDLRAFSNYLLRERIEFMRADRVHCVSGHYSEHEYVISYRECTARAKSGRGTGEQKIKTSFTSQSAIYLFVFASLSRSRRCRDALLASAVSSKNPPNLGRVALIHSIEPAK